MLLPIVSLPAVQLNRTILEVDPCTWLAAVCWLHAQLISQYQRTKEKAETVSIELLGGRIAFWLWFTPSSHVSLASVSQPSVQHRC